MLHTLIDWIQNSEYFCVFIDWAHFIFISKTKVYLNHWIPFCLVMVYPVLLLCLYTMTAKGLQSPVIFFFSVSPNHLVIFFSIFGEILVKFETRILLSENKYYSICPKPHSFLDLRIWFGILGWFDFVLLKNKVQVMFGLFCLSINFIDSSFFKWASMHCIHQVIFVFLFPSFYIVFVYLILNSLMCLI